MYVCSWCVSLAIGLLRLHVLWLWSAFDLLLNDAVMLLSKFAIFVSLWEIPSYSACDWLETGLRSLLWCCGRILNLFFKSWYLFSSITKITSGRFPSFRFLSLWLLLSLRLRFTGWFSWTLLSLRGRRIAEKALESIIDLGIISCRKKVEPKILKL